MRKSIAKEIIIGLLLTLAILLVLAVLMYAYIPNNKVVPELVSYSVPQEAKKAIEESTMDTSQVILTYEVNSSDLSTAQRTKDYNPGKVNPFSSYEVQTTTEDGGTPGSTNNSKSGGSTSGGTNSGTDEDNEGTGSGNTSSNGGTYYKDKGTK